MSSPVSAPKGPISLDEEEARALTVSLQKAARRLVGAAGAEDLVQDTLLAVHEALGTFEGRCSLRTFAIGILSRKAIDSYRRNRRWESVDLDDHNDPRLLEPGPASPEADATSRQALTVLERALSGLPERERMAVALCDVEGLDREEVCNTLGVSATHLRVLLHRARHTLRKALEDAHV